MRNSKKPVPNSLSARVLRKCKFSYNRILRDTEHFLRKTLKINKHRDYIIQSESYTLICAWLRFFLNPGDVGNKVVKFQRKSGTFSSKERINFLLQKRDYFQSMPHLDN